MSYKTEFQCQGSGIFLYAASLDLLQFLNGEAQLIEVRLEN